MNPERIGDISKIQAKTDSEDADRDETKADDVDAQVEALDQKLEDHSDLMSQSFLLNPDEKVGSVLINAGMEVKAFLRYELGQDLD